MRPQDLFLSARDFFTIIVPGGVLLLLAPGDMLREIVARVTFGDRPDAALILFAFFVCAYALGSLVSGASSKLDDLVDPRLRRGLDAANLDAVKPSKLAKLALAEKTAAQLEAALMPSMAAPAGAARAWSTKGFWWNFLRINCPAAITELDRVESQQKQFRALIVTLLILTLLHFFVGEWRWLLALPITAGMWWLYVSYRIRFARRLFELAIIAAISTEHFKSCCDGFFKLPAPAKPTPGS
ncbi:hypothetical protein RZN05_01750 [Sphingomonas sp. HF-S4]|uniref:Uncharacterized protein n=1 Tax=Sphingomonas agrestis TaxID=3080540 RepID=A0ABU3Y3B0_9SPHN|nr:hypothetical protein [Sphingomonas sp. HF-S4]MDV3455693.1 hypothetical protein [Sphingomonas sp. HF-S4]